MTEPTPELKTCPFCGGSATIGGLVPWAECGECAATGEACADEASAAAAWNQRVAPQPPAEAQPVAKLVNRKDADGGKTTTFIRPTSLGMGLPLGEYPLHLHPSAPVGNVLSALAEAVYSIPVPGGDFHKGWRDEEIWEWALRKARDLIRAQQPAPVAPVGVEGLVETWEKRAGELNDEGLYGCCAETYEQCAAQVRALAQQPVADDVDAEQFRKGWQAGFAEGRRDQQPAAVDIGQFRTAVATHQLACRKTVRDCREGKLPSGNIQIYLGELAEANRLLDLVDSAAQQGGES